MSRGHPSACCEPDEGSVRTPVAEKMRAVHYQGMGAERCPHLMLSGGGEAIRIAGCLAINGDRGASLE